MKKFFNLGEGKKEVTVLFPALVSSSIKLLKLEDNSYFSPVAEKGKYLAIGDSISQGYDSTLPQNRYTSLLCEKLNLTEHNLAIGGEVFRPKLSETIKDNSDIELVTVAYGSNDWFLKTYDEAKDNCENFLTEISKNFSRKKVFVISPIWRNDSELKTAFGDFKNTAKMISEICNKFDNLIFINGFDFVPEDTRLFGDGSLHPNDKGFSYYAESLVKNIIKNK